jgi:cell wall-associated NlpC family hydrolase
LAGVNSTIANLLAAEQRAAAARAAAKWHREHPGKPPHHHKGVQTIGGWPVPHQNSRVDRAIRAALSYLGVPYVWGGASRSGVDCSGLIMLAWDAAGVYLPHYSGAQYADTVHIPRRDIRPGDLIFYGYDGDQHVTMYLGHGLMIEAPTYGQVVHITPARWGYGYWGVGRVR